MSKSSRSLLIALSTLVMAAGMVGRGEFRLVLLAIALVPALILARRALRSQ